MTLFENTYIRAITLMSCISHVVCKANNFMYCQYTYNYIHVYITGFKKRIYTAYKS